MGSDFKIQTHFMGKAAVIYPVTKNCSNLLRVQADVMKAHPTAQGTVWKEMDGCKGKQTGGTEGMMQER